jgi:hypothetical protein
MLSSIIVLWFFVAILMEISVLDVPKVFALHKRITFEILRFPMFLARGIIKYLPKIIFDKIRNWFMV